MRITRKTVTGLLSALVAGLLVSVGAVYAAELAPQEPAYDWYTKNPGAGVFTVSNGSDLRGLSALVNGTADVDGDGTPDLPAVSFEGKVVRQGDFAISLGAQEFTPIGTREHPFQGTFEGGRTLDEDGEARNGSGNDDIRMLSIGTGSSYVGLFGYCGEHAVLRGIYLSDAALPGLDPSQIDLPTPATTDGFDANGLSLVALGASVAPPGGADATSDTVVHDVGSICGYTEGSIELCESAAAVSVRNTRQATSDVPAVVVNVGGVAGTVVGDAADCSYVGDLVVTAPSLASDASDAVVANIGGIAGTLGAVSDDGRSSHAGAATNCTNGHADDSGRFGIGKTQSTIHVVTTGVGGLDRFGVQKEATSASVGGIVGYSYGSVRDCANYGMVNTNSTAATLYKDGSSAQVVHLVAPDDLRPAAYPMAESLFKIANGGSGVGGIVGTLRGSGLGLGGQVRPDVGSADNAISLSNCFNTGMVVGLARTGGIAGNIGSYAPVDACRNGKVSAASGTGVQADNGHVVTTRWNKPMTGGIAGTTSSSISNCSNLAEVENIQTGYYTAGIVGGLDSPSAYTSECFACFNTGQVHVASYATQAYREAGLVGNNGGYLHDCVMRSGCVLSHDDGDTAYPNAAIGDDSWGMWSNVKFASSADLKKSESAAVLNASHAADVLALSESEWVYWYVKGGYPTLNTWDPPTDCTQLASANVSASCVELAEYAGSVEAIPTLVVMYGTGKQEKLVQNVDFYALPQKGAMAMTGDDLDMTPYSASIVGIGNYQGTVLNVCTYGIGPCDLKNCDVSTTPAKYNFGVPVYPEAVYVRNPAGAQLDADEFRYQIYGSATYTLTGANPTGKGNYVVFDSAGYVSWDGGATRQPVGDAAEHAKLTGDLTGVDYVLYDADGARIYEVSGGGATRRTYDPVSGNQVGAGAPTVYKSAIEGVKGGGLAGYVVKVSAAPGAGAVKKSSWTTGQYVIEAIDLYRDADIEQVTLDVPADNGSSVESRTWLWSSEKSTLYESAADPQGSLSLKLDADGKPVPASVKFTGSQLRPKTVVSYTKGDGTRVELAEDRSAGYALIYGDPYTAKADLKYFNRDATPLSDADATPPAGATDEEKAALAELAKQLSVHEKAAVTVRSILGDKFTNYVHMYFPIQPAALAECAVELGGEDVTASVVAGADALIAGHDAAALPEFAYRQGYGVRPTVVLRRCGNKLIEGTDFEVAYSNNVKATDDDAIKAYAESGDTSGLASFTVKGLGNVTGSYTGYFIVAEGKNLTAQGLEIEPIGDQPDNLGYKVRPVGGIHLATRDESGELVRADGVVEGRDFKVEYEDYNVGHYGGHGEYHGAKVLVRGINGYTGTLSTSFETYTLDLNDAANAWRMGDWQYMYGAPDAVPAIKAFGCVGRGIHPVVDWDAYDPATGGGLDTSLSFGSGAYLFENKVTGVKYVQESNYEVGAVVETPPPGEYTAKIDYSKNPTCDIKGTGQVDVTLVKYDVKKFLGEATDPLRCDAQTYNGERQEPVAELPDGWAIEYVDNVEAGQARYTVMVPDDDVFYTGTYVGSFDINAFDVSDAEVRVADQLYTGRALTPAVRVTSGDWTLAEGVDYTVTYANNTRKGTATAVVRGIGSCEGRVDATFAIGDVLDIGDADIDPVLEQLYTGAAVTPSLRVWYDGTLLAEGDDYELTYSNNVNLSTDDSPAVAKATGKGRYAGSSAEATFRIVEKRDIVQAACEIPDQAYTGSAVEPALTVSYGGEALAAGTDYEVAFRRNVKAGADARAVVTGKGTFTGTLEVPFSIVVRADGDSGAGATERFGADARSPEAFALAVAEEAHPGEVGGVVVAWRHDHASQLFAQVLGAAKGWPVLLAGHDALDAASRAYVLEHGATQAVVLGDEAATSAKLVASLEDLGLEVERQAAPPDTYRFTVWPDEGVAAVANPNDLEGAATLAAWAASRGAGLYFTNDDGTLPENVTERLSKCSEVVVAGDATQVDAMALDALTDGAAVTRLAGSGRFGECAAVSAYALENGSSADGAVVVNASSLASQLSAVGLAASRGSTLAVVSGGSLDAAAALAAAKAPAYTVTVAGGEARFPDSLCDSVAKELGWK